MHLSDRQYRKKNPMVWQQTCNTKNTNIEDKPLMLFVTKNEDTFSHVICMLS